MTIGGMMKGMARSGLPRRFAALLLLAAVSSSSAAAGYRLLRCFGDGEPRQSCCCPAASAAGEAPPATAIGRACCDVTQVQFAKAPSDRGQHRVDVAAPVATLHATPIPLAPSPANALIDVSTRPALGPPLILLKRSLLI